MPKAGVDYDVQLTISGTTYGINTVKTRGADQELDVNAMAPRIASGPTQYSHLTLWSVHAQDDFTHGMGARQFKDPQAYHKSVGSIDTRHSGVVQLASQIVASDEDLTAQVNQYIDYGGYLWAGTGAGLRVYDQPTNKDWAACTDVLVDTEEIYAMVTNGAYLFVARNGAQIIKASTVAGNPEATVFSTTGIDANATDYRYLALGGGKLWASKDGDNHVHWATSIDASDWDGDENDTNRITVGPGDPTGAVVSVPITGMQWFNGGLCVGREDGLWIIPEAEATTAYRVLDWSNEKRTTNGKGMVVWNDKLVVPVGPRLFAFTGTGISDITPPTIGQTFPYLGYGNFAALATFGPYLYVAAQEGEAAVSTLTLRADSAGSNTNLFRDPSGAANWENVDEETADYYTTYNYATDEVSYKLDTYNIETSATLTGKTINKVTVHAVSEVGGWQSSTGQIKLCVLPSGGSVDYGSEVELDSEWRDVSEEWAENPDDSAAWEKADIDDLQMGCACKSGPTPALFTAVTQIYAEVEYQDDVPYRLLCFDGAAWHNLGSLDAGGKCLWMSAATDDLWINDYDDASGVTNYNTRYMQTQQHSFLPKDDYSTSGTHSLYLSRIHCELERVDKCFHSLWFKTNNLTAARYLTAYYRTSSETWVSLGNVTQSPWEEVSLSNITGKYIDIRLDFVTDSATESPVLEAVVLEFLARPPTIYGYNITIDIGDDQVTMGGRTQKEHSARDLHTALKAARDSQVPITYVDAYGDSHNVLVTKYARLDLRRIDDRKKLAGVAQLSMADAD